VTAVVLVPVGARCCAPAAAVRLPCTSASRPLRGPLAATIAGPVGGIAGIGGGSLLAPLLATAGYPLALVAPAAIASIPGNAPNAQPAPCGGQRVGDQPRALRGRRVRRCCSHAELSSSSAPFEGPIDFTYFLIIQDKELTGSARRH
jgi:hypothetical protein